MSRGRFLTLVFGPVLIVAAAWWIARPVPREGLFAASDGSEIPAASSAALDSACRARASEMANRLGPDCRVIVRPPFVLGGDLSEALLERHYRQIIVPTARALATCYFDKRPDAPVTVLLFANDKSYERYAQRLDGRFSAAYSGYYQRRDRRIMLNTSTGGGTLTHELTHALAHFDFPEMPEWFDEGLAALFEECVFSKDGLQIRGVSNWRLNYLLPALQQQSLPSLEAMMSSPTVRGNEQAVDYAHARYFCLYLQERQLLSHFYRKYRENAAWDRYGIESLKEIAQVESLDALDRDFRRWVTRLSAGRGR